VISVVDYGSGNIQAIQNIYKRLNVGCKAVSSVAELRGAERLILPGVGAFDDTMGKLKRSGMRDVLDDLVLTKETPVLGVCVGMQVMAQSSEEGELPGLGWVNADVKRFDEAALQFKPKTPHMGWNSIAVDKGSPMLEGIDPAEGFYFLHSYYVECHDSSDVLTTTQYGEQFTSSFSRGNIFGFQFHPEKSHANGIQLFKNFAAI